MYKQASTAVLTKQEIKLKQMPSLTGMGLKDVVYLCENLGLKVNVRGKGKVVVQSINAGQNISRGQSINIQLN
jgi:cell division protein FtsI (penicillin-binding protein 3)